MVAARALALPVGELAAAIARQDESSCAVSRVSVRRRPRTSSRSSRTRSRSSRWLREGAPVEPVAAAAKPIDADGLRELVWEIMVKQLGHRPSEASQLITDALRRRPSIMSPEELFDEIYRGQKA